tara:strand:- start:1164 stop:1679 length:516 start_codon:yes stop_codon:yes gene_type:complete
MKNKKRPVLYSCVAHERGPKLPKKVQYMRKMWMDVCEKNPDCVLYDPQQHTIEEILELYTNSVFCLQPYGDTKTRQAIFDSIAMGCIPIVHWDSLTYYSMHLPDPRKVAVLVHAPLQNAVLSAVEAARNLTQSERDKLQDELLKVLPSITWSFSPPEFRDALTVLLEKLYL